MVLEFSLLHTRLQARSYLLSITAKPKAAQTPSPSSSSPSDLLGRSLCVLRLLPVGVSLSRLPSKYSTKFLEVVSQAVGEVDIPELAAVLDQIALAAAQTRQLLDKLRCVAWVG